METEHILELFDEGEEQPGKKHFVITAAIYILQNIASIILFFLAISVQGIDTISLFSQGIVLFQFFIFRTLPLVALFLFLFKKRGGWMLIFIFSANDFLQKFYYSIYLVLHVDLYKSVDIALKAGIVLTCILSGILIMLLLLKNVRQLCQVSRRQMVITIAAGIALFIFNKFYLAAFVMKHVKAR